MKAITKILAVIGLCGSLASCATKLDVHKLDAESDFTAPAMLTPSSINITAADVTDATPVEFTWSPSEYGQPTEISYSINASYNGKTTSLYTNISEEKYTAKSDELKTKLIALGVPAGQKVSVNFTVSSTIGSGFSTLTSAQKAVSVNVE